MANFKTASGLELAIEPFNEAVVVRFADMVLMADFDLTIVEIADTGDEVVRIDMTEGCNEASLDVQMHDQNEADLMIAYFNDIKGKCLDS